MKEHHLTIIRNPLHETMEQIREEQRQIAGELKTQSTIRSFMYPILIACLAYFIKFQFEQMNTKIDFLTNQIQTRAIEFQEIKGKLYLLEEQDKRRDRDLEEIRANQQFLHPDEKRKH